MSEMVVPGVHEAGERKGEEQHEKDDELAPTRHDSRMQNEEGVIEEEQHRIAESTEVISSNDHAAAQNGVLLNEIGQTTLAFRSPNHASNSAGLQIHTDVNIPQQVARAVLKETPIIFETPISSEAGFLHALSSPGFPVMGSSLRSNLSTSSMASSISHGSASNLASPYLAAMSDITPLPSPVTLGDSTGSAPWRKSFGRPGTPTESRSGSLDEATPTSKPLPISQTSPSSAKKRKTYGSLLQGAVETSMAQAFAENPPSNGEGGKPHHESHTRNRSISDFVPEHLQNIRQRHVTFGPGSTAELEAQDHQMHREAHLAEKRGLTVSHTISQDSNLDHLPTPPTSTSSVGEIDGVQDEQMYLEDGSVADILEIHCGIKKKRRKFRQLRQLGQGTFSRVMLATREQIPAHPTPEIEEHLDPHKIVAVKIVQHGPAGGADGDRIETGLRREVELLKSLSHPSLIHLKACEHQPFRTLIVLTYCPGGDLFELASARRDVLTVPMVQRIFSELVHATRYLHENWIVHRDIKLENVLVNLRADALDSVQDPLLHPTPIVTLTDLGLGRRIPDPPESPLLLTRCGSEDYAAPEILLGQPYDGRQTDAWALGVLLYALMEGRLPFDTPPGKPERSRNTHRIARVDWIWCRFGDEDGEWDESRGAHFEGARLCVEGLLKKVRMGRKPLQEIEAMDWVQNGIQVPGGLQVRSEDEDDAAML